MYHVSLAQFDGPLDLLLHLIEKSEMDIREIQISEITAQYLAYMEEAGSLDPETASEFLAMAATLLYIKSRSLLPRPLPANLEEEDPEEALLRQIREYKTFKEAGEQLQALEERARALHWRLPEEYPLPPPQISIVGVSVEDLFEAFAGVLMKAEQKPETDGRREVQADEYMIGEQMERIESLLCRRGRFRFSELFSPKASRIELIVTFMALLELLSCGRACVSQKSTYGEITIERRDLLRE